MEIGLLYCLTLVVLGSLVVKNGPPSNDMRVPRVVVFARPSRTR